MARAGFEDAVWFRIDLGRNKNAEARWVLPMLCRRGHLTKRDIGAIRVFERETRFQVSAEAIERFEAAIARADSDAGRIQRLDDDAPPPPDRNMPAGRRRPSFPARRPYTNDAESQGARSKSAGPSPGPSRPWAPPLDGRPAARPDRPAKGPKVKRPKKRKPNG